MTNSAHFASVISSEKTQDHDIMVPFDEQPVFTNVPIEGAVQAALRKLESQGAETAEAPKYRSLFAGA